MGVPFNVYNVMDSCKKIEGFDLIKEMMSSNIVYSGGFKYAIDEVIGEYEDWDAGHGFGSSDYTYARQSLIDHMIMYCGLSTQLKTVFNPYLCVIKL
jgi:hypothetical protein